MTVRLPLPLPLLLLLAACLALAACSPRARGGAGGGAPAPARAAAVDSTAGGRWYGYEGGLVDAERAAASIAGAAAYWREVRAPLRAGEDTGTVVAAFQERRLRRAAITWANGPVSGSGAYTYDEQARLFHYQGEERRRTGRGRAARITTVAVSIALDQRGTPSATRKTIGRRAEPLTAEEVAAIVRREAAARRAAVGGM